MAEGLVAAGSAAGGARRIITDNARGAVRTAEGSPNACHSLHSGLQSTLSRNCDWRFTSAASRPAAAAGGRRCCPAHKRRPLRLAIGLSIEAYSNRLVQALHDRQGGLMQRLRAYGRAEAVRGLRFLHQRRVTVAPAAHPHTSVSLPSTRVFQPCAQRRGTTKRGWPCLQGFALESAVRFLMTFLCLHAGRHARRSSIDNDQPVMTA